MNVKQMHTGVRLGVQKIDSNELDDLLPQEIDYYLNRAVEKFVNEQYNYLKNEERSIEGHFINDNLRALIHEDLLTPQISGKYPNCLKFNYPSISGKTFRNYIFGRLRLGDGALVNLRYVQPKGVKPYLRTGDNKPIFRDYPILLFSNKIYVVGDARRELDTSSELELEYIVDPKTINFVSDPQVDCDLPAHTHITIVDIAIQEIMRDLRIGEGG